ncbi:MAG: ribonuclease P protein component [Myxococcota bacterium]|nr:ribonuclease P protein component [Myxococcota bacterium]
MPTARFRPADRVVTARDYARVRRRGRRLASRNFAISLAPRDEATPDLERGGEGHPSKTRLGMAVSRKVGNAVVRNRVKRAIREWFRHSRDVVAERSDLVVVARRGARDLDPAGIGLELTTLLEKDRARSRGKEQSA